MQIPNILINLIDDGTDSATKELLILNVICATILRTRTLMIYHQRWQIISVDSTTAFADKLMCQVWI